MGKTVTAKDLNLDDDYEEEDTGRVADPEEDSSGTTFKGGPMAGEIGAEAVLKATQVDGVYSADPKKDPNAKRFERLKSENRAALVTFITACDPDRATSQAVLNGMPAAGADIIELGMPFTDPMADGPAIQLAAQRALVW